MFVRELYYCLITEGFKNACVEIANTRFVPRILPTSTGNASKGSIFSLRLQLSYCQS